MSETKFTDRECREIFDVVRAAEKLVAHWDEMGNGPEVRKTLDVGGSFWSPAGRMVSTEYVAELRRALAVINTLPARARGASQ